MSEVLDISHTIIPKSDQLNAEQLLLGPLTITVTRVTVGAGDEQPVSVFYEGDKGRPFKPCKTMRKMLAFAWGADASQWAGRAMTLFNEPAVKFGGEEVGGIRISHLSDIPQPMLKASLTTTRGKKSQFAVKRMERPAGVDHLGMIRAAATMDELKAAFDAAKRSTKDAAELARFAEAKDARKAAMQRPAFDVAAAVARLQACNDRESLALLADDLRIAADGNDEALAAIGREFDARDAALVGAGCAKRKS